MRFPEYSRILRVCFLRSLTGADSREIYVYFTGPAKSGSRLPRNRSIDVDVNVESGECSSLEELWRSWFGCLSAKDYLIFYCIFLLARTLIKKLTKRPTDGIYCVRLTSFWTTALCCPLTTGRDTRCYRYANYVPKTRRFVYVEIFCGRRLPRLKVQVNIGRKMSFDNDYTFVRVFIF